MRRGQSPLRALHEFLLRHRFDEMFSIVHLLPFFPHSSDDGFSVIDYRAVDPALGDWDDVRESGPVLRPDVRPGAEPRVAAQPLVPGLSAGAGAATCGIFTKSIPATDLSAVTRPRSLPLLTRV